MSDIDGQAIKRTFLQAGLTLFERGWLSSNSILFTAGEGCESVLVDSGYCSHSDQTVALVRESLQGRGLDRIVNTHLHADHCGGNHALQSAFGSRVDVPLGEVHKVDSWDLERLSFLATGQECPRFTRTGAISSGQELQLGGLGWKVIASPGHDPSSVVLHQADLKLLISADALWENGFGVVFPELEGSNAFEDVASTLEMIEALEVSWVIPGHGAPFSGVASALERARSRLKGYIDNPVRHAKHAAKVLLKFHLLDVRVQAIGLVQLWMKNTLYFRLLHEEHFHVQPFDDWCGELLRELINTNAAKIDGGLVRDT